MKKLINQPTTVVTDALAGIAAAHPELRVDHEHKVIYRANSPITGKVGLISGGGSGHEPLHGGFVGVGMIDKHGVYTLHSYACFALANLAYVCNTVQSGTPKDLHADRVTSPTTRRQSRTG